MAITHEQLCDTVAQCYQVTPELHDEFISFGLDFDPYKMEVVLALIESTPSSNTERHSVHAHLWFCHPNGERFNLNMMPYDHLLKICSVIQDDMEWGIISPHRGNDGEVEMGIYRCFDITPKDLALAMNGDYESELLRTFQRLGMEFGDLVDKFASIAEERVTTLVEAEFIFGGVAGHA